MEGGGAPQWLAQPERGAVASLQAQFPDVDADVRTTVLPCSSVCLQPADNAWARLPPRPPVRR